MAETDFLRDREFSFDDKEFAFIADMIKRHVGIVLGPTKKNMVYGRLARRLRPLGMSSFAQYCEYVASPEGESELFAFINALTTNLTRFFREIHHFEHLSKVVLPAKITAVAAGAPRRLRIWSAASSSGEEPYSAAMVVQSAISDIERWDAKILATDIDTNMLQKCREGIYDAERAESIPVSLRQRFTETVEGSAGTRIRMTQPLRSLITFKTLNLLERWPMKGPFDVIFCRNVAIYFDKPTQKRLFERFADLLSDDGFLYIGHAENLSNLTNRYKLLGKTIYRKILPEPRGR